jgi:Zn-dependent protease with chaperone function
MAGIPSSFETSALLNLAFRWWNRACELSADRAGLLVCGKPEKAISALVKLVAGTQGKSSMGLQRVQSSIEKDDDNWYNDIAELTATHPMIAHRIKQLKVYSNSTDYSQLQRMIHGNLTQ